MTYRYLEAAAARTLIVGEIPQDMKDLFGFTPGVHVPSEKAGEHLREIASKLPEYQDLVDKVHHRLHEVATWDVRTKEIFGTISGERETPS
ncbi:glycosyltransferase [Arthrobacter sp. Bz4]|uniref:glycosyltransferase n=1 Tax=Arthrobacter sp. Bz4 TaxID=2171979 RepID=UPI0010570A9C|nr:glycosyltransferase [Arthrobacter sp. Bz4]